jgi:hypothetical protein
MPCGGEPQPASLHSAAAPATARMFGPAHCEKQGDAAIWLNERGHT